METRQWALIAFTILIQMAVGSFLVLGVVHFFAARKAGMEQADRLSDRALLGIGPVVVLALIVSLLHLGTPLNAYTAVTNLGTSWLSREVLSSVAFVIVGAAFALMQWRKISTFAVRSVVALVAAAIGLVLLYSMSSIYLLPTQPAWDSLATPASFLSTAVLLGSLAMGSAFVANYAYLRRTQPDCADVQCTLVHTTLRWIAVVAILALGVEIIVIPLQLAYMAAGSGAAAATTSLIYNQYGLVLALRVALVFLGAGLLGMFLYRNASVTGRDRIMGNTAYAAFVLALVGEVLGRFLFYAAHLRIGI